MRNFKKVLLILLFLMTGFFYFNLGMYAEEAQEIIEGQENYTVMPEYHPGFEKANDAFQPTEGSEETTVSAAYSENTGTFSYQKDDGSEQEIGPEELFGQQAKGFIDSLGIKDGDRLSICFTDQGDVLLVTKYKDGTTIKEWEYDAGSHQVVHFYTEGILAGKPDYVEQENGGYFRWADNNSLDPTHYDQIKHSGRHTEQERQYTTHFISEKFFYDANGDLIQMEYYTSTGGTGNEVGEHNVIGRYTYRIDTFEAAGDVKTTYYNDPYPGNWDPTIEGIIIRDNFGRYFLQEEDGTKWLVIARQESSRNGAEFLNSLVLDELAEEQTLVQFSGHEYSNDIIYFDREKTHIIAVTSGVIIEGNEHYSIPITANWQARTDEEEWNNSRGITGLEVDSENNQLILQADLTWDTSKPHQGKGELYIYISDISGIEEGEIDINGKKIVMEVFIPEGFINNPGSPEHLRLFLKSGDNWEKVYSVWKKLDYNTEGKWITMEFDPMADPASWKDVGFDPSRVWELGLVITKGSGEYSGDGLRIRNIRIETTEPVVIEKPVITETPAIGISDFIDFSGRNLNFDEYNYGWCVGEFPVIWGEGVDGGFSNPTQRTKLKNALLELKSKGISTVRLMALFGDLRTGILQDEEGNFIYDTEGNLQFDSKVYDDIRAFLDVLNETGIKAIISLFDFRIADAIKEEGERDSTWLVGEHPEIFTDSVCQDAFVSLFAELFSDIYSHEDEFAGIGYDINDVVLFWEVMNEPESVCAVDFSEVLEFHDRFFSLIRNNAPGTKVTTSSLSVDNAFRFWKDKVDVMSIHHYSNIESIDLSESIGNYGFGDKPVYWTEFGDFDISIAEALDNIYNSGSSGLLFWKDNYYPFSEDDYQAWVEANQP
ncbi:MAG: hypothetical protein U9Q08_04405 [Candidatus Omnitrophota bacterium]|nr:hypothetical protein [Candidatus Omnitrophota bacterium]